MRVLKNILILCFLLMATQSLWSTHVAGGSMTYRCLGNSRYEISLEFRRDCFNGSPDAQFDKFASVTIFDANNQMVVTLGSGGQLRIPFVEDDTLNEKLTSICNVIGDDVCVQTTVYKDTLILPARPGGYILAYQRCCRNNALSNVADPLNTGATYWVRITERALQECNSSPVFENLPSVFICVNDTLRFDHRATDLDGDSLVYYLCTPSAGATEPEPMPQPSNPPPFENVEWAAGFSENNMMGGSPISIDQNTGQVLAVPNQVGQFLIGVCVREFRDGQLLSEIRRDFEYAVRICGRDPIAGFIPDTNLRCDGLDVEMENTTTSNFLPLDSIQYDWTFDYPDGNLTSTEVNPIISYPEAGLYTIQMIATDGLCYDTVYTTVGVAPTGDPTADFAFDSYDCDGETIVQFYQTSITTQANPEHIWNIRYGNSTVTLFGEEPSLNIGSDQEIFVNYEINTISGCNDVVAREIDIQTIPLRVDYEDKIICSGEDVVIFSSDIPDLQVEILPSTGVVYDGTGNYYINNFSGSQEYEISVTDGFCFDQGVVTITSEAEPDFPFDDIIQCGMDTVGLNTDGPDFYFYEWVGPGLDDPNSNNPQVSLLDDGQYYVTVYTSEGSLCSFSDSLSLQVSGFPDFEIEQSDRITFCEGDSITLSLNDDYPTIIWRDGDGNAVGVERDLLLVGVDETELYTAEVISEDGCSSLQSIEVEYSSLPVINVSGNTSRNVCKGDQAILTVVSLDSVSWLDMQGNLLQTGFQYIIDELNEPTEVLVVATNDLGCETELMFNVGLHPDPMPDLEPLDDINICPGMIIPVNLDTDFEVQWFDENGELVQEGTELLIEGISETTEYTIIVENEFGCQIEENFLINVDPGIVPEIDLMVLDSVQLCIETDFSVTLNSMDSVSWYDLGGNLLHVGTDFLVESVSDTLSFQVSVIDEFNCELRDTFDINPFSGIELEVSSSSQEEFYCEGEAINLGSQTNVNVEIQWYINGEEVAVGDSLIEYYPDGDVELLAIAMDQYGCMSTDSISLYESHTDGVIIGDSLICQTGDASLSYVPDFPSNIFSVMWTPQDVIVDDNGLEISVRLDSSQLFHVLYSNEDDCIAEDSFLVNVSGFLDGIEAYADPEEILLGESSDLSTNQFLDYGFNWSPEESLDDATSDMPVATPLQTTTYVITVTDEFGCTNTAEVTVEVIQPNCDESDIFVPNTFTPNGDDFNDVFRVESNFIEEQQLMIYNRWGEEVFYSEDPAAEWDGTYKGELLPSDVFGFNVEIKCINGFEYSKKGNITLIR